MMKMTNFDDHTQQICFSRSTVMCYKQKKVDTVLVCMIQRTKRAYSLLFLNPKTLHMSDSHVAVPEAW